MSDGRTLSLGEIAELAHVQRPVVTMWRKRPVPRHPFPAATPEGRFPATAVLDWLDATGRGKNRYARVDLALQTILSPRTSTTSLADLLALVSARCLLGEPVARRDPADVLDVVEELDGDDEWLWSELEGADFALAGDADLAAGAGWSPTDAHDRLSALLDERDGASPLMDVDGRRVVADIARHCLGVHGCLVDVAGTATDAVLELLRDEDLPEISLVLPGSGAAVRRARLRYQVRAITPRCPALDEGWDLAPGSVLVAQLPDDPARAAHLLENLTLQLTSGQAAVVLGSTTTVVGRPDDALSAVRRDMVEAGMVRAVVRLPRARSGSSVREPVLALLRPLPEPRDRASGVTRQRTAGRRGSGSHHPVRFADLRAASPSAATSSQLVADLVAATTGDSRRLYRSLRPVQLSTEGGALRLADGEPHAELRPLPASDTARMAALLAQLDEPLSNPLHGLAPRAAGGHAPRLVTLASQVESSSMSVRPGSRADLHPTPGGSGRLWTSAAVADGQPEPADRDALDRLVPQRQRTRPNDVVFTTRGAPCAVVDPLGGAAVCFPARILRLAGGAELSARAIASAINDTPAAAGAWQEWQVPAAPFQGWADDTLALVDEYERLLKDRQNVVDEFRRLVMRTVPCGAVQLTRCMDDEKEGL